MFHVSPTAFGVSCPVVKARTDPSCSLLPKPPPTGRTPRREEREGSPPRDPTDDSQEIGCFYFARFSLMQPVQPLTHSLSLSLFLPLYPHHPIRYSRCSSRVRAMNRARDRKIETISRGRVALLPLRLAVVPDFRIAIRLPSFCKT